MHPLTAAKDSSFRLIRYFTNATVLTRMSLHIIRFYVDISRFLTFIATEKNSYAD